VYNVLAFEDMEIANKPSFSIYMFIYILKVGFEDS
jgi:hypothetical protein